MSATLEMIFPNKEYAKDFMKWLDNLGEQDYFNCSYLLINSFIYDYNHLIVIGTVDGKLHLETKDDN